MTFTRYFTVTDARGVVRFSTVRQADAETFASRVFRSENVICEIHEHTRAVPT